MDWLIALPALCAALLLVLFLLGGKNRQGLFRETSLQLLLLFFLTAAVAMFSSHWLKTLFFSQRLLFVLWLLVWFFLLVFAIKTLAYFVFDFLLLKKQGIRYPKLVKDVVVFILYVVGILLILNYYLKIKITVLLASSAVFTVVVGFALQDILGNLFSGIILNFEDSFKLGDWVRINEWEGRVEQFGWRSFKIRTVDRELIVIPNQSASKAEVLIYGAERQPVALKVKVGASYHDSPDRVEAAVTQVLAAMADVLREPAPTVQLKNFGDFSLDYEVKFWVHDYAQHNPITAEVRRRIWYAFRRHGIQIPFPVRELYRHPEKSAAIPRQLLVDALKNNDILRTIDENEFLKLLADVDFKVFGGGETIIREGEESEFFYHIYSGAVNVTKEGQVVARLQAGDFIGEISLVTGEKTGATVVADRESVVIMVSSARFKQIIDMNEALAMKLSAVITKRQDELKLFSEKNLAVDAGAGKKSSESLFKRILSYFATKK
ncbi:MAG: mechanosensitive ion channel family protein [Candidatus Aminicenantes bacterium]|nr:mechanosensitive ion channel family protein [Candidatus Aminicenantes bacterium]